MVEQGFNSANTEASGAEFVRQRLDQNTRRACARQPGCLPPAALFRSQS
jgi:hypothetical protein